MSDTKILVLGATGQVGEGVVKALAEAGVQVVAGAREPSRLKLPQGVSAVRFDYTDPSTFGPALQGAQAMFLMAPPGVVDSLSLIGPFLTQALTQLKRVVFMTAAGVDFDDSIPLRQLELQIEASGVAYAHIRPSWFTQNFHTFWFGGIQAAGQIFVPAADSRTAFIDARDIAEAAAAALLAPQAPNRAFIITGPEALTYEEAAAILTRETGRTIGYTPISDAQFMEGLVGAGLPADYAGMLTGMMGAVRAGAASQVSPDFTTLTGRAPRTVAEYAREHRHIFNP